MVETMASQAIFFGLRWMVGVVRDALRNQATRASEAINRSVLVKWMHCMTMRPVEMLSST